MGKCANIQIYRGRSTGKSCSYRVKISSKVFIMNISPKISTSLFILRYVNFIYPNKRKYLKKLKKNNIKNDMMFQ